MNRSIKLILLLLISFNGVFAQGINEVEINIENLSKKWVIVGVINSDKTEEELNETFSLIEDTSLQLNNDFTCIFNFILELSGSWTLKDEVIIVKNNRGVTKWVIHSLMKNELILSRNDAKQKLVFNPVN